MYFTLDFWGKCLACILHQTWTPNNTIYTNTKNVLYTVVESMVHFTLVTIVYFPLVKLRFVIYTNHLNFWYFPLMTGFWKQILELCEPQSWFVNNVNYRFSFCAEFVFSTNFQRKIHAFHQFLIRTTDFSAENTFQVKFF